MAEKDADVQKIKELIKIMKENDLVEIDIQHAGFVRQLVHRHQVGNYLRCEQWNAAELEQTFLDSVSASIMPTP